MLVLYARFKGPGFELSVSCRSGYITRVVSQVSGLDELGHADTDNVDFLGGGHCECEDGRSWEGGRARMGWR